MGICDNLLPILRFEQLSDGHAVRLLQINCLPSSAAAAGGGDAGKVSCGVPVVSGLIQLACPAGELQHTFRQQLLCNTHTYTNLHGRTMDHILWCCRR